MVTAEYQILAPASAATSDWVAFPTVTGDLDLNPTPRRDARRRADRPDRAGQLARGRDIPVERRPAIAMVDYFRVTPDICPPVADPTAPTTGHALSAGGAERPAPLLHVARST